MSQKKPHRDDYDESRPENGLHDEPSEVANTADAANTNDSVDDAEFTEDLGSLLAEAEEKIAQYHDELLRARAEVENMRRRNQEETAKVRKFAIEGFAESLVPVKDSLEAALAASDQSPESWREGVETTLKQLVNAFERNALQEVAPAAGDKFDPNVHQAIATVPSDQAEGCVVQMLQKGYTIAGRVLRPAMVTVSSGAQA